jgi:hypothetical protein
MSDDMSGGPVTRPRQRQPRRNRSRIASNRWLPASSVGEAMNEITNEKGRRTRKSWVPAESAGEYLVMAELLGRGFDVEFAGPGSRGHDLLVWSSDSSTRRIQVRTVHSAPWYVRRATFVGSRADQVTVYVLLGLERNTKFARFFVVKNSDLAAQFRQPPNWKGFGFIDAKSVEKYEDNWDILR